MRLEIEGTPVPSRVRRVSLALRPEHRRRTEGRAVRPEIEKALRPLIDDAVERLGYDPVDQPREAEREIRLRILEGWERLRHLGVDSRDCLSPLRVIIRRKADRRGQWTDISFDVRGTPLERGRAQA